MSDYRKLTQTELFGEAKERFGEDPWKWAFKCPTCGDVATLQEFKDAGADPVRCGQECIGRHLGALDKPKTNERGCSYAAYGLFPGPWEVFSPAVGDQPEWSMRTFQLADAAEPAAVHPKDVLAEPTYDPHGPTLNEVSR